MDVLDGPRFGPVNRAAPDALVVLVHGIGADGHDLIDLAAVWAEVLPGALFIAPHAPEPCDGVPFGRQWFPYFMRRLGERPANAGFVLKSLLSER